MNYCVTIPTISTMLCSNHIQMLQLGIEFANFASPTNQWASYSGICYILKEIMDILVIPLLSFNRSLQHFRLILFHWSLLAIFRGESHMFRVKFPHKFEVALIPRSQSGAFIIRTFQCISNGKLRIFFQLPRTTFPPVFCHQAKIS